jgi:peptidoglycan/LPS O-acetylase OafA/YrhL
MVYVPHTHTAHPTARSRALAERLRATIADFQMREPKVSAEEIAMALRDAQPRAAGTPPAQVIAVVAAIGAALLAGGMVLITQRAERAGQEPPTVAITAVVIALLAAVAVIVIRVRNNG